MKLLTHLTTKIKVISSSCLLIALSGCGSGAGNSGQLAAPAPGETLQPIRAQAVVISRISTIPTNLGVGGSHKIKVDNHTGKNLTLKSFELSGSAKTSSFAKSSSAPKSAVGAIGNDSRVNLVACNSLAAGSSCTISFTPDEADGSAALRLNFVDDSGNLYPAAQLLEYSSHVEKNSGFYVSYDRFTDIATTNSYSIAIPFVTDEDYETIEINSKMIPLSKSIDCANVNGAIRRGSSCTALLTLPAANPKYSGHYNNLIKIKGNRANDLVARSASIEMKTSYNNIANLAIPRWPVFIKAKDSTTGIINIVNNGVNAATNISALSVFGEKQLAGVTTSAGDSLLSKTITCDGEIVPSLPTFLAAASICEVKFRLINPEVTGSGSETYNVSYSDRLEGAKPSKISTTIYFRGLAIPDYDYIFLARTSFVDAFKNVVVGTSVSSVLQVKNIGNKPLQNISYSNLYDDLPAGLTVDTDASTCSDYTKGKQQLMSGESCTYSLKYAPQSARSENLFKFIVKADTTDVPSVEVRPFKALHITYSAI